MSTSIHLHHIEVRSRYFRINCQRANFPPSYHSPESVYGSESNSHSKNFREDKSDPQESVNATDLPLHLETVKMNGDLHDYQIRSCFENVNGFCWSLNANLSIYTSSTFFVLGPFLPAVSSSQTNVLSALPHQQRETASSFLPLSSSRSIFLPQKQSQEAICQATMAPSLPRAAVIAPSWLLLKHLRGKPSR
jgi:hypothetical protein